MNVSNLNPWILTLITFLPTLGAILIAFLPRRDRDIRWFALGVSVVTLLVSLHLPAHYREVAPAASGSFAYEQNLHWIASPNIHYHIGIDGISLWLVVLTTFLVPFSVLASWKSIHEQAKEFFILLLVLETAIIGTFIALDLFLFYFFWEATLIPMALIIGMFGSQRRVYAAVKFFLYTMIGSVFMLVAILWLYARSGTFDFPEIQHQLATGAIALPGHTSLWLFLGFLLAFAVKVPIFPLHTWAPDAYVEAPTAGSIMLAGVMGKMGAYGLLRFSVGLFPVEARNNAPWIMTLAVIGCVYCALIAIVQPNMKKLLAYSSVSHVGFIALGIYSLTRSGMDGAVFQMLNHGVSTGALFLLVGMLYSRRHTYEIKEYGGLATPMPAFATLFLLITLSSVGLPLMNGFVGEFLILSGAFQAKAIFGIIAASGVIWSAFYLLWLYQRTFYGTITNPINATLPDADLRERSLLWPLAVLVLVMGVFPSLWMNSIDASVGGILDAQPVASAAQSIQASVHTVSK